MRTLWMLSGICVAAAGVLAVAALISPTPRKSPTSPAGSAPQIEFYWSVPGQNRPSSPAQAANHPSELQTDITPVRHHRRHHHHDNETEHHHDGHTEHHHDNDTERRHDNESEHHRSRHHHRQSEHTSTSEVSELSAPPAASSHASRSGEVAAVEARLRTTLSAELARDFELFLYVSKAANGPLAQRMYVFQKGAHGELDLLYDWPVSTGRDRTEVNDEGVTLSSFTPTGYFKLDPHRFYRSHISSQWRQPMPFAMFLDYVERGTPTGVAIHAATKDDIAALGSRASAGCIRLAPDAAETLFTLIRSRYRGLTPRFAVDHRTGTMSNDGIILHDANGRAELTEGYRVLVVVENYGGENLVAAMY